MTNPVYNGHWVVSNTIVKYNNHLAIYDMGDYTFALEHLSATGLDGSPNPYYQEKFPIPNGTTLHEGDWMSLDGTTGEVFAGRISTIEPNLEQDRELAVLLGWADDAHTID